MEHKRHLMNVHKNRLLYDEDTLGDVCDRLVRNDIPPKPTEIKRAVKTTATVYEIRTAMTFWQGGRMTFSESERVWSNCEAFDNNEWALDGTDIVYGGGA